MFCQETVEELRSVVEQQKDFPPVCFVFPAELKEGREFFDEFWPEARAVSDPQGEIFRLLDVSKASLRQIFGPGVWVKALQAMKKGYRPGRTIGNPWLLPGIFLIENSLIRWKWRFKNIGDHPDFSSIGGYR